MPLFEPSTAPMGIPSPRWADNFVSCFLGNRTGHGHNGHEVTGGEPQILKEYIVLSVSSQIGVSLAGWPTGGRSKPIIDRGMEVRIR